MKVRRCLTKELKRLWRLKKSIIAYRKEGKLIEEKAGRQFSDKMTPAKASEIRALRKKGKQDSNTERRANIHQVSVQLHQTLLLNNKI